MASPSGEGPRAFTALRSKMAVYRANGARLGWLLLPEERAVKVWSAEDEPQRFNQLQVLEAGAPFQGLQLQLEEVWSAYARFPTGLPYTKRLHRNPTTPGRPAAETDD